MPDLYQWEPPEKPAPTALELAEVNTLPWWRKTFYDYARTNGNNHALAMDMALNKCPSCQGWKGHTPDCLVDV